MLNPQHKARFMKVLSGPYSFLLEEKMLERIKQEPALVTALISALLGLFGVAPNVQQTWLKVATILLPIILGLITRQMVTPVAKMAKPKVPEVTR